MATVYCHGSQKLENLNLHIDLCHFWIILTAYMWSKELAAQNYIFTPFGGLFVTMYTTNYCPTKFLINLQEEKIQASILFKYTDIYLQNYKKYPSHPQSPLFTYYPP